MMRIVVDPAKPDAMGHVVAMVAEECGQPSPWMSWPPGPSRT